MSPPKKGKKGRALRCWFGIAFPLLAGLLIWATPLGSSLNRLSYDLLFLFRPAVQPEEAVIVYMDERSFRELGQQPANWDRRLHAKLLDRLTADEARLVVFDVWLTDPGDPEANRELREAIQRNGRVVLAQVRVSDSRPGLLQRSLLKPLPEFLEVATNSGIAEVVVDRDGVVRRAFSTYGGSMGLAQAAANCVTAMTDLPEADTRWLNYYGPQGTISSVSYCDVTNQPAGYFRGKAVFLGSRPRTVYAFQQADEFRAPYARWGGEPFPGVEILTTEYLNLGRGEWLSRLSPWLELLLLAGCGLLLGWVAECWKRKPAAAIAAGLMLAVCVLTLALHWGLGVWFCWMLVPAIQLPAAIAWRAWDSLTRQSRRP